MGQQDQKVVAFQLGVISTSATSATTIDTIGFNRAIVDVCMSPATATNSSAKWTALKIQHGTTTDPTNHTNVTGGVGTTEATATSSQFVLSVHNDAVNCGITRFFVNLDGKARFLRIEKRATPSHQTSSNSVQLFRGGSSPDSAADAGVTNLVNV